LKNRPAIAVLVVIAIVAIGVGSVTDAFSKIAALFQSKHEPAISPLVPPIRDITPPPTSKAAPLVVRRVLAGQPKDAASKVFDVTLANNSASQLILSYFDVEWRYHAGYLTSIGRGDLLTPLAKYIVKLPINTEDETLHRMSVPVYPPIILPPRNADGPSVVTFRLQLHYYFQGRLDYHPQFDWNIRYRLSVRDDEGNQAEVLTAGGWRE